MEAAIRFFSLQKASAGNVSISWIWFGGTLKETTGSFKLCSYEKLGQRTKWQFLGGSSGQCSAHYWQIPLSYHRPVLPHMPRVVSPKTESASLECIVNKWLSIVCPPKHNIAFILLWTDYKCQHHCEYQAGSGCLPAQTLFLVSSKDIGGRICPPLPLVLTDRSLHIIYAQCYIVSHHLPSVCVSRTVVLTLPNVMPPNHKIISLLLHNCKLATAMSHNVNTPYAEYLICDPCKRVIWLEKG